MARITPRPRPTATQTLTPLTRHCPTCGNTMWAAYHNYRTVTTLSDVLRLTLKIRHCITPPTLKALPRRHLCLNGRPCHPPLPYGRSCKPENLKS